VQDKLNALLEKHCATIKENVETVGQLLRQAGAGGPSALDTFEQARGLAHQLKGSSGTAGFKDICTAAITLYDHLNRVKDADRAAISSIIPQALVLFEPLQRATLSATPRTSSLYAPMPRTAA
jgi:chemotaxis protein histidine kinase CheA